MGKGRRSASAGLHLDEVVRVSTDDICAAIKDVFEDTRAVLEPAGALAVAGAKAYVERRRLKGETLVAVASGANMNFDRLRFIAERAEVGEHRRGGPVRGDHPGGAGQTCRKFCALIGQRNVTEFNYRIADAKAAHIFVGIQTAGRAESGRIAAHFSRHGFKTLDLTGDEMAKLHVRHLVGGRTALAKNEPSCCASRCRNGRARWMTFLNSPVAELEHQRLPLPQPRRRFRPDPRRAAWCHAGGDEKVFPQVSQRRWRSPLLGTRRTTRLTSCF